MGLRSASIEIKCPEIIQSRIARGESRNNPRKIKIIRVFLERDSLQIKAV